MRILIFSELFYPHGGGAELATWLYSKLLAEKGFEVTIITRQFPNEPSVELLNDRITIFRIPMKNLMLGSRYDTLVNIGIMASSLTNKLIAKSDVIYIPCSWYSAIPVAKIRKKPVIVHLHNYSITCPTSLMYDFVKQTIGTSRKSFILHEIFEKKRSGFELVASSLANELIGKFYNKQGHLADALIFVSNAQRDLILSKAPQLKSKGYVIYNPIPNLPYIKAKNKAIGYFGGKSFVKGFHILIQALKSFRGLNGVQAYMTKTSKEHKATKLGNGVLVEFLPKVNLESIMEKLSIVVIPSLLPEPSPYILIESMMYGRMVIASNVGGIPEIVNGVSVGVKLVKPGDSKEIVDALASFLAFDFKEVDEIGMSLREKVLQKFDNERTINSFINVLDRISR